MPGHPGTVSASVSPELPKPSLSIAPADQSVSPRIHRGNGSLDERGER